MATLETVYTVTHIPPTWLLARAYRERWKVRLSVDISERVLSEDGSYEEKELTSILAYWFISTIVPDPARPKELYVIGTVVVSDLDWVCDKKPLAFLFQHLTTLEAGDCYDRNMRMLPMSC